jgi:hypothetical protein
VKPATLADCVEATIRWAEKRRIIERTLYERYRVLKWLQTGKLIPEWKAEEEKP